ncbi:MAG: hypothetical protein ACI4JJ_06065, partial [Huintestinicola sp.]
MTTVPTETETDTTTETTVPTETETSTETTTETEPDPVVTGIAVDSTNFPDEVFRNYVSTNFDTDGDGYLSDEEIAAVTDIDVSGTVSTDGGVTSLEGVEFFTELTILRCKYNSGLTALDVSNNTYLTDLYCRETNISILDVSNNTALKVLYCNNTNISTLDVSNNTALNVLYCNNTNISILDVSNNTALTDLNCESTNISTIDVRYNSDLTYLSCYNTGITTLDVTNNTALIHLYCMDTNLTILDLSNNADLEFLNCSRTNLSVLDVSNNTALSYIGCIGTKIAYIDVTNNTSLTKLGTTGCQYQIPSNALTFDTSTIDGFDPAKVSNVANADFDSATGIFSNITGDITYTYDCGNGFSATFTLARTGEAISGVAVDSTNFPDSVFMTYVSTNFDTDGDGYLSNEEIAAVTSIDVSGTSSSDDGGVASLEGVEYFSELKELICSCNAGLTNIDISNNTALTTLYCNVTNISTLDLSNNTALQYLYCGDTNISTLDVSNNTALE